MTYKNDTMAAVLACESSRTGNYGEDYDSQFEDEEKVICPLCGHVNPDQFYIADSIDKECLGCSNCVKISLYPDERRN